MTNENNDNDTNNKNMNNKFSHPLQKEIRRKLRKHGTNVAMNDADETGDGDQSEIRGKSHSYQQFYRDLFAEGADLQEWYDDQKQLQQEQGSPSFAMDCIWGRHDRVRKALQEADDPTQPEPSPALIRLLETREGCLRLSPLLLIVSIGKNLNTCGRLLVNNDRNDTSEFRQGQQRVARLLLEYGARPDAKNVGGKTVVHYGAGMMATKTSLAIVDMAFHAYQSSHLFGKQVELVGLQDERKNGQRGVARGYYPESNRRAVFLYKQKAPVAVRPENIKLVDEPNEPGLLPLRNLCDIQDRLGSVSMLEVLMRDRADVAKFLIHEHHASVDIADYDGYSPKSMSVTPSANLMSSACAEVIKEHITKQSKAAMKKERRKCAGCEKPEETSSSSILFSLCSKCKQVRYCSRECQVNHWPFHKVECKTLAQQREVRIVLEKPPDAMMVLIGASETHGNGTFQKPQHVKFGEKFWIKVQGDVSRLATQPMLIYDETRQCKFYYPRGSPGFQEMMEKVAAEPAFCGLKTYMKASFDKQGRCTVYPSETTLKKW